MLSTSLEHTILRFLEDLDTSFSLMCSILYRYGDFDALVRLECRPVDYVTPEHYFRSVAALAILKKLKSLPLKTDKVANAKLKWWDGEHSCYKTNQRLYPYLPGTNLERDERVVVHIARLREIVVSLIGYGPPDVMSGRFGPGATFADKGSRATVPDKINNIPALTSDCVWFLPQFLGTAWGRYTAAERDLSFVRGNRFSTAPKTAATDRSIAIEPSINVFFQLAAGRIIRDRLRRSTGWDLDHAQDTHRRVARDASVTHEFATLDLSNASDTVASNFVKLLLPPRWFEVLSMLRSPMTTHPDQNGKWVLLEKFSSMGNGYTFELETVLFAALALYATRLSGGTGVLGEDTFVFGDDIIVKDNAVKELTALLTYFGFSLNREKSFWGNIPFRESCGADFMSGVDVRPSYIKEDPQNVNGAIGVCNRVRQVYDRVALMGGEIRHSAWFYAVRQVPLPYRNARGPKDLGDAVIWDDESAWTVKWRHSIRYILAVKPGATKVVSFGHFPPQVVLACALYGTGNVGTPEGGRVPRVEGVTPRDAVLSYRIGWLAFS